MKKISQVSIRHVLQNNHYLWEGWEVREVVMNRPGSIFPYWLSHSDHSMELDNVWVLELAVDSCLLQELDFILFFGWLSKSLDGHIHWISSKCSLPPTSVYNTKFTRTQWSSDPDVRYNTNNLNNLYWNCWHTQYPAWWSPCIYNETTAHRYHWQWRLGSSRYQTP